MDNILALHWKQKLRIINLIVKNVWIFYYYGKTKKENQQIDKMICIGKDDKGVEQIFNLDTYLKRIKLPVIKDESEMYNPQIIKNALLEKLNG